MKGISVRRALSTSARRQEAAVAAALLLPTLVLLLVFSIVPLGKTVYSSFFNSGVYQAPKFVGWANYDRVLHDRNFTKSIMVGIRYMAIVVPFTFVLSFLLANAIKCMTPRMGNFVKSAIYVPSVISGIIAGSLFAFIYDYQGGLLNVLMDMLGLKRMAWLNTPGVSLWAVALPGVWLGLGYATLMMLAGILDIPQVYYEAALIDGANAFKRMWYITIPCMRNVFLFQLVSGAIGALQEFNLPYVLTSGAPAGTTRTPVLLLYQHFTQDTTMGYTYAGALVMAVIIGLLTALFFRTVSSEKAADV